MMDGGLEHCTEGNDKDHPQEKEMQKGKIVFWGALQIAEKTREAKGKWEKERYTHLNAEFQRIARREESLLQRSMQRNRGKQYNEKEYLFL